MSVEIEVARHAGVCFGVERALEIVAEAAESAPEPVCTLGPLIHNPLVVGQLAAAGVRAVDTPADAAGHTLVLRAHGVTPEVEDEARSVCARVIDATCPFVMRAHRAAARLAADGYQLVVVGEAGHPEVEGTAAHARSALVIASAAELAEVELGHRVGVVVQTTMARERLHEVVDALRVKVADLRVVDTICEATSERQRAASDLAGRVDVMVVVGGRNSANTTHLVEICREGCASTHHVELPDELDATWFCGVRSVGVTAGASTPQWQIDAVVVAIRDLVDGH